MSDIKENKTITKKDINDFIELVVSQGYIVVTTTNFDTSIKSIAIFINDKYYRDKISIVEIDFENKSIFIDAMNSYKIKAKKFIKLYFLIKKHYTHLLK